MADQYCKKIQDTILQHQMLSVFNALSQRYNQTIGEHQKIKTQIYDKAGLVRDYEIILKLMVTQQMIDNYQRNEFPDVEVLQDVNKDYYNLLEEINAYLETKK
jgi:hypothetical protein